MCFRSIVSTLVPVVRIRSFRDLPARGTHCIALTTYTSLSLLDAIPGNEREGFIRMEAICRIKHYQHPVSCLHSNKWWRVKWILALLHKPVVLLSGEKHP